MLKYSAANAKTEALKQVDELKPFLDNKRKIYSLDLLSGYSCPFAKACLSKAVDGQNHKRHIVDGPENEFRCFSASQETLFPEVFNSRKNNFDILKPLSESEMIEIIVYYLPENADVIRIHVGGDFFSDKYFVASIKVAILFLIFFNLTITSSSEDFFYSNSPIIIQPFSF